MHRSIIIFTGIVLFFVTNMIGQNKQNSYEADWKLVAQYEKKDLPQSAAKEVENILKKAVKQKNTQQVIKALLVKNKYNIVIDRDNNTGIFSDLSELLANTSDETYKALLHSLLAELYNDYYNFDSYTFNRRKSLNGTVPKDMHEWSWNIFRDKVTDNLSLSINNVEELKKHTTKEYSDIIEQGKDAAVYYPTLYDFLMKRAIDIAQNFPVEGYFRNSNTQFSANRIAIPAADFVKSNVDKDFNILVLSYYKQYFTDLLSRNMTSTIVLIELDKANYMMKNDYSFSNSEESLSFLQELFQKYIDENTSVVLIEKIINRILYQGNNDYSDSDTLEKAYAWCSRGLTLYPNSPLIDGLIKIKEILETPQLNIEYKYTVYPDSNVVLSIHHKNLQSLEKKPVIELYRISGDNSFLKKQIPVSYTSKTTYQSEIERLDIGRLEPGSYFLVTKGFSDNSNEQLKFRVSRIATFSRNNAKHAYEVYVVDRITGNPISDAIIYIYNSKDDKLPLYTSRTDVHGLATFSNIKELNGNNYFRGVYSVMVGNDLLPKESLNENYKFQYDDRSNNTSKNKPEHFISVFTDRSIYRPGQTLYFKSIIIDKNETVVANEKVSVILKDNNGNEIGTKQLQTNEFGSVAGEFILPKSGLLGNYFVEVKSELNSKSEYFKVEEYKRPTFDITFDKIERTYTFGEQVTIKGYAKNYSGASLQDVPVSYSIGGQIYSFWRSSGNTTFYKSGELKTKADGSFEISFVPQKTTEQSPTWGRENNIQKYTLDVKITDLNGETQSGSFSLLVGDVSMVINMNIPNYIKKSDTDNIKIEAKSLNGANINTSGEYTIFTLLENDSINTQVAKGTFKTGVQPILKDELHKLQSGKYRILLTALDSNGNKAKTERDFVLFSYEDKCPPIKTNEWLVKKNTEFSDSVPAEIIFGVSDKNVHVIYNLYNNDKVFDKKYIVVSGENKTFTIPYLPEYGDQIYLTLTYIKDEVFYNRSILLTKKQVIPDKKLNVKFEVFRDKLRPGQEESWTISVTNAKKEPVFAEVLASMYDKSLDNIYQSKPWYFIRPNIQPESLRQIYYFPAINNYLKNNTRNINWYRYRISPSSFSFDKLMLFGFTFDSYRDGLILSDVISKKISGVDVVALSLSESPVVIGSKAEATFSSVVPPNRINSGKSEKAQPEIRSNLFETAFFFPQLRTNEKGETLLSFKAPENNTEWVFRALAHDVNLNTGFGVRYVVTRKELMVTPNMPRFVRQGDKTSISTKLSNLSDKAISGKVRIEFFDPVTEKAISLNITNKEQRFALEKDASSSVSWTFDIPSGIELLGCRIIAASESFSDGEQHVLPVLSNRMLVTESMPFDVTEPGEREFTFNKLKENKSATLSNYRLTLEYAANPAWYAVMALPVLSNPESDNAAAWFASYYVNMLGADIMRQYPQVAAMIKAWKAQGGNKDSFISNLNKNEELKNIILTETPWVLDARNETEQMQKLSLLFDLNNSKQQTAAATHKLQSLQDGTGGWCWFRGFYPSRSMTLYILSGYAHLQEIGQVEYSADIKQMQINALNFLDKEIVSDFENLKKSKDWKMTETLSTNQIEYLYTRSYYRDIPISQEARQAERFYMDIAIKNWVKLNLYERSLLITPLLQDGDDTLAKKIANSIRERAIIDKSKGMYWPNNTNELFSTGISVVNHTFYMDALYKTGATTQDMNLMKQWLIRQKQTQQWKTTHGTINAIYALLSTGNDWFSVDANNIKIKVGKETVNTKDASLGTGYIKSSWEKVAVTKDKAIVKVMSDSDKPSYGALYWQYYENLDKITGYQTNLKVEKKLFKEMKDTDGNPTLISITDKIPLKVGDKVTFRFTVNVDEDIDYVQLKDMRAPCFEPIETTSGTKWDEGIIYYKETRDASMNFYFDRLRKGTYVFEYSAYINRTGTYSDGITSIQSQYAPEFASHTQGGTITVKE